MALTTCKDCQQKVSKKAKMCPNCGAVMKKNVGCVGSFLVLLVLCLFGGWIVIHNMETSPSSSPPQSPSHSTPEEITAKTIAETLIIQYIVTTKGFAKKHITFHKAQANDLVTKLSERTYHYTNTVQYRNVFNADMESQVNATIQQTDGETWELLSIEF